MYVDLHDLSGSGAVLVSDGLDGLVLDEQRVAEGVVAKGLACVS